MTIARRVTHEHTPMMTVPPQGAENDQLHAAWQLMARIKAEYGEMPGLSLTLPQAARFWDLDVDTCRLALDSLVREQFLVMRRHSYVRSAE